MNSIQPRPPPRAASNASMGPNFTHGSALAPGRRRERSHIVLGCGIGVATLAVLCAALLLWDARHAQFSDWRRYVANLSTTIAAQADQTMNASDLVLTSVLETVQEYEPHTPADVEGLNTAAVHEALHNKVSGMIQVDVASIFTLGGKLVNFSRSWPTPPIDLSDRDYVKRLGAGPYAGTYLSEPVRNRGTGQWTFYLARQIQAPNGQPIGIVAVGISSRFFQDFFRAANLGGFSTMSLFRADGVLLAREPDLTNAIGRSFVDGPLFREVLPHGDSTVIAGGDLGREADPAHAGTLRIVGGKSLQTFPMASSVTVVEDVVLKTWRRTAKNVALLTFAFVTALLGITYALMRLFDRQDRTLDDLVRARHDAEDAAGAKTILIEKLRASEAQLSEQSKVLEVTLDHMDQGLIMVDSQGRVAVHNRRVLQLLDLPRALLQSRPQFSVMVDYQRAMGEFVAAQVSAAHVPGAAAVMTRPTVYERTRPNGTILEVQSVPLPDGGMVRTFTDITQRRRSEEQIRHLAHHDGLTQLANRVVFLRQVAHAIELVDARRGKAAVLYLDLDGFKLVNDTYGHAVGDELLVEVGQRLRRVVRGGDTVARMGGDEFAIVQPMVESTAAAEQLATRVLAAISPPYRVREVHCTVGVSIGIALYPAHADGAEELLRHADIALYRAKAVGKGAFCVFDMSMDGRLRQAFRVESELSVALATGQFFLEYQPIVHAGTLDIACYEALVRWRHPVRGVIGPEDFIAIAERTGQIVALGLWVIESACREASRWAPGVDLSVNVSPVQFSRGDLAEQVHQVLDRTGFPAHRLILEITEGVMLEPSHPVLEAMSSLRARGVRFSLDDFGAAQSRLTYFKRFPFDVLKIDRGFVQDAVDEEGARSIVRAVLSIGRAFRLKVVAEGVEREEQLALLREMQCDMVQGLLTGAPHDGPGGIGSELQTGMFGRPAQKSG